MSGLCIYGMMYIQRRYFLSTLTQKVLLCAADVRVIVNRHVRELAWAFTRRARKGGGYERKRPFDLTGGMEGLAKHPPSMKRMHAEVAISDTEIRMHSLHTASAYYYVSAAKVQLERKSKATDPRK